MKSCLGRRNSFAVLMCAVVLAMIGTAFGGEILPDVNYPAFEEPNHTERPEYVENELIVKFRGIPADAIEMGLAKGKAAHELKLSDSLDKLNKKYKLRKAKPLFKNFRSNRQRVKALLKKDKALLSKKEKHILRRLKRAPKGARVPDLSRIYKLQLDLKPGQSLEKLVAAYNNEPDVEYAELNYIISINLRPNEPYYSLQWPLDNTGQDYPASGRFNLPPGTPDSDIDAPEAWDVHTGSSKVIVAVIDTGVDYNHRDLWRNMWVNEAELNGTAGVDDDGNGYIDDIFGYDFFNDDIDPVDDHGHGTHCAGIIAAEGDNTLDIAGVCWHARIMALKFLGSDGWGNTADAVGALHYAVENGADVISNSWGSWFPSATIKQAVNYAHSQGAVVVAAAGNDNSDWAFYPAYYDHTIAVAATNSNDQKAPFSNYGDWVDIAAPGVDILSLRAEGTSMGITYNAFTTIASGTSMACPHVSGACALLLSVDPNVSVDDLRSALMVTADPISPGICDSGRLNVYGAMLRMLGPEGNIWLDSDVYSCFGLIGIKLFDTDLSTNETQEVTVSTDGGDSETLLLAETSPTLGIFVGTVSTGWGIPNVEDGMLQLSHGQIITVTYYDVNDGTGNPAIATDTAVGDCQGPAIFNVEIDVPGPEPTVTFETDEPTTARVLYSQSCGDPNQIVATDAILATSHGIKLSTVSPESDYFFIVEANDGVGNQTVDDNAGQCYAFTTDRPGDIYVPAQYATIQEAIDHSWDGGTVWVADGTYTGEGNRDLDFGGKAITVRSENGPENCIIDCNGTESESHRGFYFHSGEDANSVLAGFTITNGYVSGSWYVGIGGAILCDNHSSPTITNCIIIGNSAGWDGGGMFNKSSNPMITSCTFSRNSAVGNDGGAIDNEESSSPTITNCTFNGNSAYDWGGAIRNVFSCNPTITNCTFSGNSADDGGAMFYYHECTPTITNCTFAGNSARNGNALACDSWDAPSNLQLINCILWDGGNEIWNNDGSTITITYSDIQDGYEGEGNINADPCFVEPGHWADANGPNIPAEPNDPNAIWIEGNYHLSPNSPCIDAGDNVAVPADTTDLDGDGDTTEPIPWDLDGGCRFVDNPDAPDTGNGTPPIVDMGAYEFAPAIEVPMKFTPQALNPSSKGRWLKAHFVLPEGFVVEDVDANVPATLEPVGIESDYINVFADKGRFGEVGVEIGFDRAAICGAGIDYGPVEVTVTGRLISCEYFYGTDTIRIINNNLKYLAVLASHWLEAGCGRPDWCGGVDLDRNSAVDFVDFVLLDGCCIEVIKE